jgi:hypothetical protein
MSLRVGPGLLDIAVNGTPVCETASLNWLHDIEKLELATFCKRKTVRAEFERIEVVELRSATASDFRPLFNGKDLTGWAGAVENYEVRDGLLTCKPLERAVTYDPLQRRDFIARVEFRLAPGAEGGLLIRYPGGTETDATANSMCEIQILDDTHLSCAGLDAWNYNGSVWGLVAATRGHLEPLGEWNVQEVAVRGSTVKVELNGAVIFDTDLAPIRSFQRTGRPHPGKDRMTGFFGIQSGPGINQGNVEFRRVEIGELPTTAAAGQRANSTGSSLPTGQLGRSRP